MTQYKCENGTLIEYKSELTMDEFWSIQALSTGANIDPKAANEALVKLLVTKITTPDGSEHSENLEKIKIFGTLNTRDGVKLIKIFGQIISGDDSPKAT